MSSFCIILFIHHDETVVQTREYPSHHSIALTLTVVVHCVCANVLFPLLLFSQDKAKESVATVSLVHETTHAIEVAS